MNMNEVQKKTAYEFGNRYLGPFLTAFACWLEDNVQADKISRLFFLSRDGYMMKKAYEGIFPYCNVECRYVYFSRKSLIRAAMYSCKDYKDFVELFNGRSRMSAQELLSYMNLSDDAKEAILRDHHLDLDKDINVAALSGNDEIRSIFEQYCDEIHQNAAIQFDLVEKYLLQEHMSGRVAVVDIGWHGSMQLYLEKIVRMSDKISAEISGYYVGINTCEGVLGITRGLLFNDQDLRNRPNVTCALGMYERLFQKPEGSTEGYTEDPDGTIRVIKGGGEGRDPEITECVERIQKGAMDCINQNMSHKPEEYLKLTKPLVDFGRNPGGKYFKLFDKFYIEDGEKNYYLPQKGLAKYSLSELKHDLHNSPWKTGFMKKAFGLPLPYIYVYSLISKK